MSAKLRIACLASAVLLGACAVGPDYRRPEAAAPAAFRDQTGAAAESTADLPWWSIYRDPILQALIRQALAGGYDPRIAAARVEESRALEAEVRGQFLPSVGYDGNASRGRNTLFTQPNPGGGGATTSGFDGYLAAAWELDLWGRIRRLDEAARSQLLEAEAARRGVLLSLVSSVATDYFQLLELDAEVQVAQSAVDSFGESLKLFNERLRGGVASRLETSSAEAALASSAAQIPALHQQIAFKENELCLLLGRTPGVVARGAPLASQETPPEIPVGLPSDLLERRPDVMQAEGAARAANANIGVTIGGFLPRIGLSGLLGAVSSRLQSITDRKSELWAAGAQVTGPIFAGGALKGEYRAAREAWELAKLQYQQAALNAFVDTSNALVMRTTVDEIRTQREREVGAYKDAVQIAMERYKAGNANYYEVLQAQQQLFPAEVQLAQARRDRMLSLVELYRALGGGWKLDDDGSSRVSR